jgi:hypothetical protein
MDVFKPKNFGRKLSSGHCKFSRDTLKAGHRISEKAGEGTSGASISSNTLPKQLETALKDTSSLRADGQLKWYGHIAEGLLDSVELKHVIGVSLLKHSPEAKNLCASELDKVKALTAASVKEAIEKALPELERIVMEAVEKLQTVAELSSSNQHPSINFRKLSQSRRLATLEAETGSRVSSMTGTPYYV